MTADNPTSVGDILRVDEVIDGRFYANALFRRRFGVEAPDYPRHYVAFYRAAPARFVVVGYVHHMVFEDSFLCGGLVIDEREYRRIPASDRGVIKKAGGIAEKLLRDTFGYLSHAPAIWAYVGDRQSERVCLRAGFRRTAHAHVMVVWNRELPEDERSARLARVVEFGPF